LIVSDVQGKYSFTVSAGDGSVFMVTPSSPLYTFAPLNMSYPGLYASKLNQNFTAAYTPTLNVILSGSGGGTVAEGFQGGYSCSGNPCPTASYPLGTAVKLIQIADSNSFFISWSSECAAPECSLTMDATKSVTVTFDRLQWAKNEQKLPPFYGLLINAYNDAGNGAVIKLQGRTFSEDLQFDNDSDVILDGGYNADFQTSAGFSYLQGTMKISNGKVTVRNLKIR
jgi:hypothetical protein